MRYILISLILFCLLPWTAFGQKMGVKSNLLYDAVTTMNLGVEFGLGRHSSLDVSASYNPWTFPDNRQWRISMLQPEYRYWTCSRFNGHFFGFHLHGGEFNFNKVDIPFMPFSDMKDFNYQGTFYGAGVSYGYQWILGNRWGLEATVGVGYSRMKYDKYPCTQCGTKLDSGTKNYWGPTKAGINLIFYIF